MVMRKPVLQGRGQQQQLIGLIRSIRLLAHDEDIGHPTLLLLQNWLTQTGS